MVVKLLENGVIFRVVANVQYVEILKKQKTVMQYSLDVKQIGEQYSKYYSRLDDSMIEAVVCSDGGVEVETLYLDSKIRIREAFGVE